MTTRISGLGTTGLDIDSIVSQMMKVKQAPIDQMIQKRTSLTWQRDAYRDVNTDMSSFMNEAQKLTLQATFMTQKTTLSTTDAGKVQVSPTAKALTGNFSLKVDQIAKVATVGSNGPIGSFTATAGTINVAGSLGNKDITINAGDSVSQIVANINGATASTGVKAVYDQLSDKVTFVSSQTGAAAKVNIKEISATSNLTNMKIDPANQNIDIPGQDAEVYFNGSTDVIKASSNSFTLNNINFTLLADPVNTPYTINGSNNLDVDNVVSTIKGVFDKYNTLIDKMNSKISETKYRDYTPLTDDQKKEMKDADITLWEEKAKSGLLRNDSILSSGLNAMRNDLSSNVSGIAGDQYNDLSDIGITTYQSSGSSSYLAYLEKGKIYIDEDKLRTALINNPDQVANLFTKDGARDASGNLTNVNDAGIGTRLYDTLKKDIIAQITAKTQVVPTQSYLNQQINDYTTRIQTEQDKLSDYEQSLYNKYTALQTSLENLSSQGSQLASYFK
ncbi:flagellar filament capping protein FliD [Paenibacillus chondroitinus]|uniref:Flagellar hook-associated protein 2 n=1 Tax=Paenibacillus chondroitinus TaxID=59842 RepID=A0ABU6DDU9_9BACL|nr:MULTISPECIES: flagellar filament capping protein FliD [Paenibacillus]MCY9660512.1 flagellar filament capping protein FliD [Paenibacillus anseongense]MEB4795123.1 flagellar filament capping protein FliD [Paenibacillus chondroitinus]